MYARPCVGVIIESWIKTPLFVSPNLRVIQPDLLRKAYIILKTNCAPLLTPTSPIRQLAICDRGPGAAERVRALWERREFTAPLDCNNRTHHQTVRLVSKGHFDIFIKAFTPNLRYNRHKKALARHLPSIKFDRPREWPIRPSGTKPAAIRPRITREKS